MIEIGRRRSNFTQFSDDLWCYVKDGSTRIDFEVDRNDLKEFAMRLMDMAYVAMQKIGNQEATDAIGIAMDVLDKGE